MLGKLSVPGVLLVWIMVGQGPTAVDEGGGCLDVFALACHFSFFSFCGRRPNIDRNTVSRAVRHKTTNQIMPL